MPSVLVTGGGGFIGTHLCRHLHDLGHHVISLDIMHTDSHPWECITADIRDNLQFDGIDYIVHLAAQISVPRSIDNPDETLSVNVDGTKSIISAAETAGVKKIVFASSAAVYGDCEEIPITEGATLIPQSPYAVSKIVGEELLRMSNIETCSLRFFNVYGPGQTGEGALLIFIRKALKNETIHIDGDGNLDVVSAAFAGDEIAWYENSGAAIPEFSNILMPIVSVLTIIGVNRMRRYQQ